MKKDTYRFIKTAFKRYRENKQEMQLTTDEITAHMAVDYSRTITKGTPSLDGCLINKISKTEECSRMVKLVEQTRFYFELEGFGRDIYLFRRFMLGKSQFAAANYVHISERTAIRWERDIFEKAATIIERKKWETLL